MTDNQGPQSKAPSQEQKAVLFIGVVRIWELNRVFVEDNYDVKRLPSAVRPSRRLSDPDNGVEKKLTGKGKSLVFVLEDDRVEAWEQAREAQERLAGKKLSDIEVFDLMCAETLCTYATTPAFPDSDEPGEAVEGGASSEKWRSAMDGSVPVPGAATGRLSPAITLSRGVAVDRMKPGIYTPFARCVTVRSPPVVSKSPAGRRTA